MAAGIARDFCREGGYEDRISALPNDMLLQILTRLGCARAATETGVLARRWRGLWTRLPVLTFHRVALDSLVAALAMVSRPAPSLLDIYFFSHHMLEPERVSSLLRAAAAVAPAEFVFYDGGRQLGPVELPCFDRTTSIKLDWQYVSFTLPPAGSFPALESFHLENGHMDVTDMLPRCLCLKKLSVLDWNSDSIMLHLETLEDLAVYATSQIRHINIVAPALKRLYLDAHYGIHKKFTVSFSAPAVENLTWKRECRAVSYSFGVIWCLWRLTFAYLQPLDHTQLGYNSKSMYLHPLHRPRVGVLSLNLETNVFSGAAGMTFEQEIYQFQVTNFSVLELELTQRGHVYGVIVLHFLGLFTSIQTLTVILDDYMMRDTCYADCCCDQPNNWRSQSISLIDLKEVEIQRCRGEGHEVDLLKVLLRCATMLERVTPRFSRKYPPSDNGLVEINDILKTYPSVRCNIYH